MSCTDFEYRLNSMSTSEVKGVDSAVLCFFSFYGHFPIPYLGPPGKNEIIRYILICKINFSKNG